MMKLVEFDKWCGSCINCNKKEVEEPCNDCLGNPVNDDSHKPIHWEEDKKRSKKE